LFLKLCEEQSKRVLNNSIQKTSNGRKCHKVCH